MKQIIPVFKCGFSTIELLIVIGIIGILAIVSLPNLVGRRSRVELDNTARQIAASLREAQSRSLAQESATSWGVHFENSTTTSPFYALFKGSYSSSTRVNYSRLPSSLGYATSSIPLGAAKEVTFSQISGLASAATSTTIYLLTDATQSSTISVASSGAVSY